MAVVFKVADCRLQFRDVADFGYQAQRTATCGRFVWLLLQCR
jgi:hypothetical protein